MSLSKWGMTRKPQCHARTSGHPDLAARAEALDSRWRNVDMPCIEPLGGAQYLPNLSDQRRPIRHSEEPLRRSNPGATTACAAPATQTVVLRPLDRFASLAMTDRELAHLFLGVALVEISLLKSTMVIAGGH